jgi:hypothetical protein
MLLAACLLASSTVCSCGLTDIKDNIIAGALAGVKGAATNWVDGFIVDLNEFFEAIPDTPIDTP